jgi:hypothetical protein
MPTGIQGQVVPSARAERFRNFRESVGVWAYAAIGVSLSATILAIILTAR